jgi:hypothetical protein
LRHGFVWELHERGVELGAQRFFVIGIEAPLVHMADDADNFWGFLGTIYVQALSDGILAIEEFLREDFINDGDAGCVFVILRGKESAAFESDAHCFLIVGPNYIVDRPIHFGLGLRFGLAVNPEKPFVVSAEWDSSPGKGNSLDSGSSLKFALSFAQRSTHGIRACVKHGWWKRKPKRQDLIRFEARIYIS